MQSSLTFSVRGNLKCMFGNHFEWVGMTIALCGKYCSFATHSDIKQGIKIHTYGNSKEAMTSNVYKALLCLYNYYVMNWT